jgi:hypothetical protein
MRIVAGNQDVAGLAAQAIADPLRRVFGLKVARRLKRCEGVAGAPVRLGRLTGAKLAAVPDHRRVRPTRCGFRRKMNDVFTSLFRERATRVDVGADRVAVVNEIKDHNDQRRNRRARRKSLFCGFREFCAVRRVISERKLFRRRRYAPSGDSPAAEWGTSYRD